jgi:CRISPR/Cas system-associated exonuclease Cas4 (RecB family)
MNISYHAWKAFNECPRKFLYEFVEKRPATVEDNDYPRLYGLLVQKFFELFCNNWRFKTPYIFPEIIRERLIKLYDDLLCTANVNWDAPIAAMSKEELLSQAVTDVCAIMDSMNQNHFLNTRSEISIELELKNKHIINGRLDFVHTNPMTDDDIIFDGKGTNTIGKNVSNDQLYFYALLYSFKNKRPPAGTGFFYYRHNTFIPVFTNPKIINDFRVRLSVDIKDMTTRLDYIPTPCAKSCKYCRYMNGCKEGQEAKAKRARKSVIDMDGTGIIEFGI